VDHSNEPTSKLSASTKSNVSLGETYPHIRKKLMSPPSSYVQHPGTSKITKRVDGLVSHPSAHAGDITQFQTPPLLPGLLTCLLGLIGRDVKPFPIQSLSIAHFIGSHKHSPGSFPPSENQTLLASETGSGKSIAYLLPLIQALKATEKSLEQSGLSHAGAESPRLRPRAIILAPTHELCRQLTSYAKTLSHDVKLRTVCLSNPPPRSGSTARQFAENADALLNKAPTTLLRQADIVVGTPSKVTQMAALEIETDEESPSAAARPKTPAPKVAEMSLRGIEWVIIDEVDVMFGKSPWFYLELPSHSDRDA
jgi:ATP-dependent RNA helicase MRH4